MPGISTSEITRSGGAARACASAWRAPLARATSCPATSSSEASASRLARLSSTTRIEAMRYRQWSRTPGARAVRTANYFVIDSRKLLSCIGYTLVEREADERDDQREDQGPEDHSDRAERGNAAQHA